MINKRLAVSNQRVNPPIPPLTKGGKGGFEAGFTLVELMITIVIFVFVIAAASSVFTALLTQFKQQSKITETNIEGAVGLEILRRDLESAGYGLPWRFQSTIAYSESANAIGLNYNDSPNNSPRAIVAGDNVGLNGSDYLVIKSLTVARTWAAGKWTYLKPWNTVETWTPNTENVNIKDDGTTVNTVRVIVISPGSTDTNSNSLVVSTIGGSSSFFTNYQVADRANFAPPNTSTDTYIMYGVYYSDPAIDLRMPFNRADYYINIPTTNMPRCAPNTGVLYKAIVNQGTGSFTGNTLPILDCVADMQVIYRLDMDSDSNGFVGTIASPNGNCVYSSEVFTGTVQDTLNSAALLRTRLKEVRVYILAHEGQMDRNYSYPNQTIIVGETTGDIANCKTTFDLSASIGSDWRYYRWKVYTLVIRPNLR